MATLVFHLVHGTQLYLLRRPRARWLLCGKPKVPWVLAGSPLRQALERSLGAHHQVEFRIIEWSGRNRHGAREQAAEQIAGSVADGPEDGKHFVIAHSHGGNASLLALKPPRDDRGEESSSSEVGATSDLAGRLAGIACLSTPFLVVREAEWALQATVAWAIVVLFGLCIAAEWRFDGLLPVVGLSVAAMLVFAVPFSIVLRRYRDGHRWTQAPEECRVPVLILRCPGDEASSGLGFAAILARAVFLLEQKAAWPVRWLQRHPVRMWLVGTALLLAFVSAVALLPDFGAWMARYWSAVLLVLFGPLLLGVPLRLAVYGLAYGLDLLGLPLYYSISAETTPLGRWVSRMIAPPNAAERHSAHSGIYDLEDVHDELVAWVRSLTEETSGRPA